MDPNARFRMFRWKYALKEWEGAPIFGLGFGTPIIPPGLIDSTEVAGQFNIGMPHNTFLFVAVRMGMVGLLLIVLSWAFVIARLLLTFRRTHRSDELAAANVLISMFGFAFFVLFFERPVTNVAFWIAMAIGARLIQFQALESNFLLKGKRAFDPPRA